MVRDLLTVSLNLQGAATFASVVEQNGPGAEVDLGEEAYWWEQSNGGLTGSQLSVLNGTSLITVYTLFQNDPPSFDASQGDLENLAEKVAAFGKN